MPTPDSTSQITIGTLLRYWIGDRSAILAIASSRWCLAVGFLFVFSAAFAREYDGHDLFDDPGILMLPLVASLITSFLLWCGLCILTYAQDQGPGSIFQCYPAFLSLYWMTAPQAWLYAIPVERFMSEYDAAVANLCLLGLVATWRVVLMIRVVQVTFSARIYAAATVVLLVADTVAIVALFPKSLDDAILRGMSGVHRQYIESAIPDTESLIKSAVDIVLSKGTVTWPVWMIVVCFVASFGKKWKCLLPDLSTRRAIHLGLWALAVFSLLVWIPILPFTQPPLQKQTEIENALMKGDYADAIRLIQKHYPDDLPPHWSPTNHRYDVWKAVLASDELNAPAGLKQKFIQQLESDFWLEWPDNSRDQLRFLAVIKTLPHAHEIARDFAGRLRYCAKSSQDEAIRQELRALLESAGVDPEEKKP